MKKLLVFGASNSSKSINKTLAIFAARQLNFFQSEILDLNDFEMPIYSSDREEQSGIPFTAISFAEKIQGADGIIVSFAEHNGSYSAAFKNILDWVSRHNQKAWNGKIMLVLSTSPGGRGGSSVLNAAKTSFPHFGANVVASFSLPSFQKNYSNDRLVDSDLANKFTDAIQLFKQAFES